MAIRLYNYHLMDLPLTHLLQFQKLNTCTIRDYLYKFLPWHYNSIILKEQVIY